MSEVHNATKRIFHRVHTTGEEIKNDLPNWVERAVEAKVWEKTIDPSTGKPFEDVGKWLVSNWPLGPGMGQGRYTITYDEFIVLCEDRPALKDLLIKHRPTRKRGGDRRSEEFKVSDAKFEKPATPNSRLYIEERLQRDHKAIWKAYLRGEHTSARKAGIAAGFIKDTHNPLMRLKSNWNKASAKEKRDFLKWVEGLNA
jgi:hypothetical protein